MSIQDLLIQEAERMKPIVYEIALNKDILPTTDDNIAEFSYSEEIGKAEFEDFINCKVEEARHTLNPNAPVHHLLEYLRELGFTIY